MQRLLMVVLGGAVALANHATADTPLHSGFIERGGIELRQFLVVVSKNNAEAVTLEECKALERTLSIALNGKPQPAVIEVLQAPSAEPPPVAQVIHLDLQCYRQRDWEDPKATMRRLDAQSAVIEEVKRIVRDTTLRPTDELLFLVDTTAGTKGLSIKDPEAALKLLEALKSDPDLKDIGAYPIPSDAFFNKERRLIETLGEKYAGYLIRLMLVGMELPNLENAGDAFFRTVHELRWVEGPRKTESFELFVDAVQRRGVQLSTFNLCDSPGPDCVFWVEAPFPIWMIGGREYGGSLTAALNEQANACVLRASLEGAELSGRISIPGKPRGYRLDYPEELFPRPEVRETGSALHARADILCRASDGASHQGCMVRYHLYLDGGVRRSLLKDGVLLHATLSYSTAEGENTIELPGAVRGKEDLTALSAVDSKSPPDRQGVKGLLAVNAPLPPGKVFLVLDAEVPGTDLVDTFVANIEIPPPTPVVSPATTQRDTAHAEP